MNELTDGQKISKVYLLIYLRLPQNMTSQPDRHHHIDPYAGCGGEGEGGSSAGGKA